MFAQLFFPIIVLFASPELTVERPNPNKPTVSLEVTGKDAIVNDCLDNGQEIRYRFEMKVCDSDSFWSSCSDKIVETHFLSWNPISNSYQMINDLHRDHKLPEGLTFDQREEALIALRTIKDLDLGKFSKAKLNSRSYLQARAFSECRGEYSKTLEELSYYLSFGLLRLSGFSTGWKNFHLHLND
jgi:hypothetical protein